MLNPKMDEFHHAASLSRADIARFLGQHLLEQFVAKHGDKHSDVVLALDAIFEKVLNGGQRATLLGRATPEALAESLESERQNEAALEAAIRSALDRFAGQPEKLTLLTTEYARLAMLFDLAGHLARENFLDEARKLRDKAVQAGGPIPHADLPGFIERILYPRQPEVPEADQVTQGGHYYYFRTLAEVMEYLARPRLEIVLTAHPTFIDTLSSRLILREMHDAMREITAAPTARRADAVERLDASIRKLLNDELTPLDAHGHLRNFTHREEIETELQAFRNSFNGIADVYGTFDRSLAARFKDEYDTDARHDLTLNLSLSSWITGDKDGNRNMKAEHLLLSQVLRQQTLVELIRDTVVTLEAAGIALPLARGENGDERWLDVLTHSVQELDSLNRAIAAREDKVTGDIPLSQAEFDGMAAQLRESVDRMPPEADLIAVLEAAARAHPQSAEALAAYRRVRTFGFTGVHAELRETSDEYTRVVEMLLDIDLETGRVPEAPLNPRLYSRYSRMTEREKADFINKTLLQTPDYFAERARAFLRHVKTTDALRSYSDTDERAIAYHTLKRHQLAAQFPEHIKDMVLAECRGTHHVMEALAVQFAVTRKPQLAITPLLEQQESLEAAPATIREAIGLSAFRRHMLRLADGDPSRLVFKYQIAHSDNTRRDGLVSSKANIREAAYEIDQWPEKNGGFIRSEFAKEGVDPQKIRLAIEWFHGGSMGHILRNGGRSMHAHVNAFGTHGYTKLTYQGGDLPNYFNYDPSFKRMAARFFTHAAKELAFADNVFQRDLSEDWQVDRLVIAAFHECRADYQRDHFNADPNLQGYLFAHPVIDFDVYGKTANRTTRSAGRGKSEAAGSGRRDGTKPLDVSLIRTIGHVEIQAAADLQLSWAGGAGFMRSLSRQFVRDGSSNRKGRGMLQRRTNALNECTTPVLDGDTLTPAALQALYKTSSVFREIVDFVATGLASSHLDKLRERLDGARDRYGVPVSAANDRYVNKVLPRDYNAATRFVLAAFGQPLPIVPEEADVFTVAAIYRHAVQEGALSNISEIIGLKNRLSRFPKMVRDMTLGRAYVENRAPGPQELKRIAYAELARLRDTHGRYPEIDDPHYKRARARYERREISPQMSAASLS